MKGKKLSKLRNLMYAVPIALGLAGGVKQANAQNPKTAYYLVSNVFIQPNDSDLNWYGSGDVDKNNKIDWNDVLKMNEVIFENYTNPFDKRLNDRCDVNGDSIVNLNDRFLLEDYLNNFREYLPGHWNKLKTKEERKDWVNKMLKIGSPQKTCFDENGHSIPDCDCTQISEQALINYTGKLDSIDIKRFLKTYTYDTSNIGRFNLPLLSYDVQYFIHIGNDTMTAGHAMNGIVVGDDLFNPESYAHIEPQYNRIIREDEGYFGNIRDDSIRLTIGYIPTNDFEYAPGFNATSLTGVFEFNKVYDILKGGTELIEYYSYLIKEYPYLVRYVLKTPTKRDSISPKINIISPIENKFYNPEKLNLESYVSDTSIFDRFRFAINSSGKEIKDYYNKDIFLELDSQKINNEKIFKYTKRNLQEIIGKELSEGEHELKIYAKDLFYNESSKKVNFFIDKTFPEVFIESPKDDSLYANNENINLKCILRDKNLDLKNSNYILNGIEYSFSDTSVLENLNSRRGMNELELFVNDKAGNLTNKKITYFKDVRSGFEENVNNTETRFYPNPVQTTGKLNYPEGKTAYIEIYDGIGRKVKQISDEDMNGETNIDFSDNVSGVYFYKLKDSDGKVYSGKVLKD